MQSGALFQSEGWSVRVRCLGALSCVVGLATAPNRGETEFPDRVVDRLLGVSVFCRYRPHTVDLPESDGEPAWTPKFEISF
jgi:hypothetical protein